MPNPRFARRPSGPVGIALTAVAILSFLLPLVFVGEWRGAQAAQLAPPEAPPNNAPPQEFTVGEPVSQNRVLEAAGFVAEQIGEVVNPPVLPEGFESARVPTFAERLAAKLSPALSLFASTESKTADAEPPPAPPSADPKRRFDFDGDNKADVIRWRGAATEFKIRNSDDNTYSTYTLGTSSAKPVPADYDGDGLADVAVFDAGTWTIRTSTNEQITTIPGFGQSGDIPMSGNFHTGSPADELAVYRPSNNTWYYRQFSTAGTYSASWGASGDIPVGGYYNTDSVMDFAVYRPSTGVWWIAYNGGGSDAISWGASTDVPVPADYDGDGRTDAAVFRPSTGTWWVLKSYDSAYFGHGWGNWSDQPAPADHNGDGKADIAVWRPSSGVWHIDHTAESTFEYHGLGSAGDFAATSAYVKQVGGSVPSDALSKARLAPRNATGGTDLYSQNFAWGTGLAGLPGRSGLDMGFGISYNSLVWTKEGSTMHFDADWGNVSPGFRLGFPTIEPAFYDSATGVWNYLMVTPSGGRVGFRQTTASNVYETYDSSYAQLTTPVGTAPNDPAESIAIAVVTTDGTRMLYEWKAGAFRCKEIKDRNGNYIAIVHDEYGRLNTATDTLGRTVAVNYDAEHYPTSVYQFMRANNGSGAESAHVLAAFAYTDITLATDWEGVTPAGPPTGTEIKVLEKVFHPNGAWTKFLYNGYAQVRKIENYAPDNHLLNYTRTNLDSVGADQTDAPRFTLTATAAENFNVSGGTAQEVVVHNSAPASGSVTLPGNLAVSGNFVDVWVGNHPDDLRSKTWFGSSGWSEGLPLATEDCITTSSACSDRKRWTWTGWEQDQIGLTAHAFLRNPRVLETRVGDAANVRKTAVAYLRPQYAQDNITTYGLVNQVQVFGSDLSTVLKESQTQYNLATAYTSRRIIGLPAQTDAYGRNDLTGNLEHVSKATYAYDEGDFSDTALQQNIFPVRHDAANFGASFIAGRGNLTSSTRWDVTAPSDGGAAITSSLKYNTAGSVVAKTTPWDGTNTRTVKIGYADDFNSTVGGATYAYPTSITDPAGHASTVKYRFDIGANVEANSPAPAGNTYGKRSKRTYDAIGRLERDAVWWNPAGTGWAEQSYVRYEFPTNGVQSKVYAPIVDVDGDGNIAEDEVYSESWSDGAGRTRRSRTEHPGSTGGWASTLVEYDKLGRVTRQSVPTETNSSYAAAGDDATRNYLWSHQKYDWMGRVVRKIATDGEDAPTANDSDVFISYEGCGCAGGLVTTVEGELVPRTDTTGNARRKQKTYADILGRTFKTETYEWNGTSVYSTVLRSLDGADRPIRTRQYAGDTSSTTYQDTTATFDGHGRLATQHVPQQSTSTHTGFTYYEDGNLHVKTDARGATSTMTYDNRGLVTSVENEWAGAPSARKNFALLSSGSTPTASSVHSVSYPISAAFNGDRTGMGWGNGTGGWNDNTHNSYPDWLQVDFDGAKTIDEIDVFTIQDNEANPSPPTETMTFTDDGIIDFEVQYWSGSGWSTVSGGGVTGNDKVWRKFTFSPVTTEKIRVVVSASQRWDARYSRIAELEAWGPDDAPVDTTVGYGYDDLGNRTSMTDLMGSTAYAYDSLSRLKDETRSFADSLPNAPLTGNGYKVEYQYNLSGGLKKITDPFGEEINYASDRSGRLTDVTGSSYANITEYAENAQYTAWGGLKGLTFGNNVQMATSFDNRNRPDTYQLTGPGSTPIMNKAYDYYSDGRLKFVDDGINAIFDRLQTYDHSGRIKDGKSGAEASGGTVATENQGAQLPYRQSYVFNAFGDMTQRNNLHWGKDYWNGQSNNLTYIYENGRVTGWTHDAEGRPLVSYEGNQTYHSDYDARGLLIRHNTTFSVWNTFDQNIVSRYYNGDGREVKRQTTRFAEDVNATEPPYGSWSVDVPTYYIRSSVLGGETLTDLNSTGRKIKTHVIAAGAKIAEQSEYIYNNNTNESVSWNHADASGMSHRTSVASGSVNAAGGQYEGAPAETDPMGGNMGTETPYIENPIQPPPPENDFPFIPMLEDAPMIVNGQRVTCSLDGMAIGCAQAQRALESGSAIPASLAAYQHLPGFSFTSHGLGIYTAFVPGHWTRLDLPDGGDDNEDIRVRTDLQWVADENRSFYFGNVSWGTQVQRREIIPLPGDLRDRVVDRAKPETDCGKAVQRLIDRVSANTGRKKKKKTDIGSLFDKIGGAKKIVLDPKLPVFRGETGGANYAGAPSIRIGPAYDDIFARVPKPTLGDVYEAYATVVIHELIHNAAKSGHFSDQEVLQAAIDILKEDGIKPPSFTTDTQLASQRINTSYLRRHCEAELSYNDSSGGEY